MIFTRQPSPMVRDAARTYLPADKDTTDQIIRDIIEGRPDAPRSTKSNVTGDPSDQSPLSRAFLLPRLGEHSQMEARVRQSQDYGLNRAS